MKRIFLVGNGSSLHLTPLRLLEGEDSMGMNLCHLMYPYTSWRPTHYFCIDVADGDERWRDAVKATPNAELFLWDEFEYEGRHTPITRCKKHHFYASDNTSHRVESWHLPSLCTAFSSIYPMMQLAVMLGYEEIYLLGCDLWTGKNDHFSPDYVKREDVERRNRDALWLHQVSKQSCPVPIYNATVGGNLETYPRVDIWKVLGA